MKSTIASLIVATLLGASAVQAQLSISTAIDFETEYIFRGLQLADESIMPSIDFAYDSFYFGIWSAQPITKSQDNEIDFYGGVGFDLSEGVSVDFGVTLYYYPVTTKQSKSTEVFRSMCRWPLRSISTTTSISTHSHWRAPWDTVCRSTKTPLSTWERM